MPKTTKLIFKKVAQNIILKVYHDSIDVRFIAIIYVNNKNCLEYFGETKDDCLKYGLSVFADLIYANNYYAATENYYNNRDTIIENDNYVSMYTQERI